MHALCAYLMRSLFFFPSLPTYLVWFSFCFYLWQSFHLFGSVWEMHGSKFGTQLLILSCYWWRQLLHRRWVSPPLLFKKSINASVGTCIVSIPHSRRSVAGYWSTLHGWAHQFRLYVPVESTFLLGWHRLTVIDAVGPPSHWVASIFVLAELRGSH